MFTIGSADSYIDPLLSGEVDVEAPCSTVTASMADDLCTWSDPFYSNDATVIAAFTFDYEKFDRRLAWTWRLLCCSVVWVATREVYLFIKYTTDLDNDWYWHLPIVFSLSFWVFAFLATKYVFDRSKQQRRHCLHIALTERGIYVDEVIKPGSRQLMRRLDYKYARMQKCEMFRKDFFGSVNFQVVVLNLRGARMLQIDGLIGAQRFVDFVNEMIQRVPHDSVDATEDALVNRTCEFI